GGAGTEACLQVNVYAPADAKKEDKLPVLVWIHGGGNPIDWPFDHWIHQVPQVVIVSVYYRVDAFGFLAHPEFASDSTLGDMNTGIQDQTEALRWVQKNIAAFGGDPDQVTIDGQSAGASSVEIHLVAPQQEGLFHQAIAQSVYRTPLPTPEQQEPLFNFFAETAGCGLSNLAETMACLRNASVYSLAHAQDASSYVAESPVRCSVSGSSSSAFKAWRPVLDGKIISQRPTASILAGNIHAVPLLVGATSNESLSSGTNLSSSLKSFFPLLSTEDLTEFNAAEIMGDAWSTHTDTYMYRYNTPNPEDASGLVEHAAEIWMMFKGVVTGTNGTAVFYPQSAADEAFVEELIAYWLSFVRSGSPNTFKLARAPEWPLYRQSTGQRMVLTEGTTTETGSAVETIPSAEVERCAFVATKADAEQA
ncbi:hypothetical protein PHLGIDRAFT_78653, partial [Phlebiopsis gigantea 11061_1 CR5-6]